MKKVDIKNIPDWETNTFYYRSENKKELKIEDFMTDDHGETDIGLVGPANDEEFRQTVEEVKAVRELTQAGRNGDGIAKELGLTKEKVTLLQMCLFGVTEDGNDEAAAHLVIMEK